MKLKVTPEELVDSNGHVRLFPWVCPHCDRAYWYSPNESFHDGCGDQECRDAWLASIADESVLKNPGQVFWKGLFASGVTTGKGER